MKNAFFLWFFLFSFVPAFALNTFPVSPFGTTESSIWKVTDHLIVPGTRFPSLPLSQARGFFIRPNLFITNLHVIQHYLQEPSSSRWTHIQIKKNAQSVSIKNVIRISAVHDLALVETTEATDSYLKLREDPWNPKEDVFILNHSAEHGKVEKIGDLIQFPDGGFGFFSNHYSPFGRSGSPVTDHSGKIVGVLHGGIANFLIATHYEDVRGFMEGNTGTNCNGKTIKSCFAAEIEKASQLANEGHTLASRMLGIYMSSSGRHEESLYWMGKAARAGDMVAQFLMAFLAVPRYQARNWLAKSVEKGFPPAQYELAQRLQKGPVLKFSQQEQKEQIVELLKQSSASGYIPSLRKLSRLHRKGILVEKNRTQALRLYQQVTKQHNLPFYYYLNGSAMRNKCRSLFLKRGPISR